MRVDRVKLKVLIFLVDPTSQKVCLAQKAYGIKKGLYNGYGGKIERGESPKPAAIRELKEEAGITAEDTDLILAGRLLIHFPAINEDNLEYVFLLYRWRGTPKSTKEMVNPTWFEANKLPYSQMLGYYPLFLTPILQMNKRINAYFVLDERFYPIFYTINTLR